MKETERAIKSSGTFPATIFLDNFLKQLLSVPLFKFLLKLFLSPC